MSSQQDIFDFISEALKKRSGVHGRSSLPPSRLIQAPDGSFLEFVGQDLGLGPSGHREVWVDMLKRLHSPDTVEELKALGQVLSPEDILRELEGVGVSFSPAGHIDSHIVTKSGNTRSARARERLFTKILGRSSDKIKRSRNMSRIAPLLILASLLGMETLGKDD